METNPAYGLSVGTSALETTTDLNLTLRDSEVTPASPQLANSQTVLEEGKLQNNVGNSTAIYAPSANSTAPEYAVCSDPNGTRKDIADDN